MKNVLDANQWANPRIGQTVLTALFSTDTTPVRAEYRPVGCSAREAVREWAHHHIDSMGSVKVSMSPDRTMVVVEIDGPANTLGYVENWFTSQGIGLWSGKCYLAPCK